MRDKHWSDRDSHDPVALAGMYLWGGILLIGTIIAEIARFVCS